MFGKVEPTPDVLFHRVLGGYSGYDKEEIEHLLRIIMEEGLVPKVADEYKQLVPEEIRDLPIVWLGRGEISSGVEQVLFIRTKYLDPEKLYDLQLNDVDWWVYQGHIPAKAIRRMVEKKGVAHGF